MTVYPSVTHLDAVRARAHLGAWAWSRASFMKSHLVSLSDFCSSTLECQGPVAAPGPHRHAPAWFQEGAPCPPCTSPHCSSTASPSANPASWGDTWPSRTTWLCFPLRKRVLRDWMLFPRGSRSGSPLQAWTLRNGPRVRWVDAPTALGKALLLPPQTGRSGAGIGTLMASSPRPRERLALPSRQPSHCPVAPACQVRCQQGGPQGPFSGRQQSRAGSAQQGSAGGSPSRFALPGTGPLSSSKAAHWN